jgi:hypothetical protein
VFQILTQYCSLFSALKDVWFKFLHAKFLCCLFTYQQPFPKEWNHQIIVRITVNYSKHWTSVTLNCHRLYIKTWWIWFCFLVMRNKNTFMNSVMWELFYYWKLEFLVWERSVLGPYYRTAFVCRRGSRTEGSANRGALLVLWGVGVDCMRDKLILNETWAQGKIYILVEIFYLSVSTGTGPKL